MMISPVAFVVVVMIVGVVVHLRPGSNCGRWSPKRSGTGPGRWLTHRRGHSSRDDGWRHHCRGHPVRHPRRHDGRRRSTRKRHAIGFRFGNLQASEGGTSGNHLPRTKAARNQNSLIFVPKMTTLHFSSSHSHTHKRTTASDTILLLLPAAAAAAGKILIAKFTHSRIRIQTDRYGKPDPAVPGI